jgi:hypothetical protein
MQLPPEVDQHFDDVLQMLRSSRLDPDALGHCENALMLLKDVYSAIWYISTHAVIESGTVWRWAVQASAGYIRLVQAGCQPALVIFAHFATATSAVRTAWYTQHWAEYAINGMELALDETMQHWVQWPREHARERLKVLGVQLPADDDDDDMVQPMLGHMTGFGEPR